MVPGDPGKGNQLLTAEDIAAILKISLNTVHNREWQKRSRCPLMKIGRRTYVLQASFWNWVQERGMVKNEQTSKTISGDKF